MKERTASFTFFKQESNQILNFPHKNISSFSFLTACIDLTKKQNKKKNNTNFVVLFGSELYLLVLNFSVSSYSIVCER